MRKNPASVGILPLLCQPRPKEICMGRNDSNKTVMALVWITILAVGGWLIYTNYLKPLDVEADLKMTEKQLAAKYSSTFTDNPDMVNKVPQYSEPEKNVITVRSDGVFDVIYANGKQIGVGTADKKAHAFNVKWGDGEETANRALTFTHDTSVEILNDMAEGNSTATFFPNESGNDCFVYVRNNTTGRLIYMVYYNDLARITGTLGPWW